VTFNPAHVRSRPHIALALLNKDLIPAFKIDSHKLHIGNDFNLVPVGGGEISYNSAGRGNTGKRDWKIADLKISAALSETVYADKNTSIDIDGKQLTPLTHELNQTSLTEKDGVFSHAHTDGQAMAWNSSDTIYIAFRGTANMKDVKQDALLAVSNRSHDAFDNFVLSAAILANKEGKNLVLTGHSLGANHVNEFANKAAINKKFSALKDASFIGFASPSFSKDANVLNIGMKNDPVFGVLSISTHRYTPKLFSEPKYVAGLKYGHHGSEHIKNPHAHSMQNIQKAVDQLTQFGRLNAFV
jgi:hypothetical protein